MRCFYFLGNIIRCNKNRNENLKVKHETTGTETTNNVNQSFKHDTSIISLRLRFRRNFLSVLHLNLVSSPIKGILEIFYLTTRCIPIDILAWTDCVRSSAGNISYIDIFSSSNLQQY
jgi:hypothetical protein